MNYPDYLLFDRKTTEPGLQRQHRNPGNIYRTTLIFTTSAIPESMFSRRAT